MWSIAQRLPFLFAMNKILTVSSSTPFLCSGGIAAGPPMSLAPPLVLVGRSITRCKKYTPRVVLYISSRLRSTPMVVLVTMVAPLLPDAGAELRSAAAPPSPAA